MKRCTGPALLGILLFLLSFATPVAAERDATTEGLTMYDQGFAATYAASWDNGGWDAIVHRHMAWGQAPARFVYRTDGQWCVHPDFGFGDILTLRNSATGVTTTCTIGDAVAPQDQAYWRRHFVVELAYTTYAALDLQNGGEVQVWVMPGG